MLTFVGKLMSLLFNTSSRFFIAFLPRSKLLFISWLQSQSAVILQPKKIKSATVSIFYLCLTIMWSPMWAYANNHTIYHKPDNLTFQVWLDKESFWRPSCSLSLRNSLQTAIVFKSENIRPYGYKKKKKKNLPRISLSVWPNWSVIHFF